MTKYQNGKFSISSPATAKDCGHLPGCLAKMSGHTCGHYFWPILLITGISVLKFLTVIGLKFANKNCRESAILSCESQQYRFSRRCSGATFGDFCVLLINAGDVSGEPEAKERKNLIGNAVTAGPVSAEVNGELVQKVFVNLLM